MKIMLAEDLSKLESVLSDTLIEEGYGDLIRVSQHDDIFKKASNANIDMLIVNIEEADTSLLAQLKYINDVHPVPVVIFSEKGNSDVIRSAVQAGVSAFIVDGLAANRIKPVLTLAIERFNNYSNLREELKKTKESLANRKVIEKAKGLIMKQQQCTEDEAYSALRKLAMDRNQKLSDVASSLVELSSLLVQGNSLNGLTPK